MDRQQEPEAKRLPRPEKITGVPGPSTSGPTFARIRSQAIPVALFDRQGHGRSSSTRVQENVHEPTSTGGREAQGHQRRTQSSGEAEPDEEGPKRGHLLSEAEGETRPRGRAEEAGSRAGSEVAAAGFQRGRRTFHDSHRETYIRRRHCGYGNAQQNESIEVDNRFLRNFTTIVIFTFYNDLMEKKKTKHKS